MFFCKLCHGYIHKKRGFTTLFLVFLVYSDFFTSKLLEKAAGIVYNKRVLLCVVQECPHADA